MADLGSPAARGAVGRHLLRRAARQVPPGLGVERPRPGRDGRQARRPAAAVRGRRPGQHRARRCSPACSSASPRCRCCSAARTPAAPGGCCWRVPLVVVALLAAGAERSSSPSGCGCCAVSRSSTTCPGGRSLVTVLLFVASWLAFGLQTLVLARVGRRRGRGRLPDPGRRCRATRSPRRSASWRSSRRPGSACATSLLRLPARLAACRCPRRWRWCCCRAFAVTLGDVLLAGSAWVYARSHRLLSAHPAAAAVAARPPTTG